MSALYGLHERHQNFAASLTLILCLASCEKSVNQVTGFQARVDIAEQLILNGQAERGNQLLDQTMADFTGQPGALLEIGRSYLETGAHRKAEQAFLQAIRLGSHHEGYLELGRLALINNDSQSAKAMFGEALSTGETNVKALNGLGVAHDLSRQHVEAQRYYKEALAIAPGHSDSINNLGLSLLLSGNAATAIDLLSEVSQSGGHQRNKSIQNLALALYVSDQKNEARALVPSHARRLGQFGDQIRRYRQEQQ